MIKQSNIRNIILLLIGCTILIGIIWKIGIEKIYIEFLKVDKFLLVVTFFICLLAILIKAHRWNKLFDLARPTDAWKIYMIGMAVNQVLPTGSGELTRAYIARSRLKIPIEKTIVPVVIERIADTTFIVGMSLIGLIFITFGNEYNLGIVPPLMILFSGYFLLIKPNFLDRFTLVLDNYKEKENIVGRIISHISQFLKTFKETLIKFDSKKKIIWQTFILTIVSWSIYGVGIYMLVIAFGYNIQFLYILAITSISEVIGTFSFLPGGLGTKEISFAVLMTKFLVPIEVGISVFIMLRIMTYIQLGVGAFISLTSFAKTYPIEKINKNEVL